jgi:hypothetical protein
MSATGTAARGVTPATRIHDADFNQGGKTNVNGTSIDLSAFIECFSFARRLSHMPVGNPWRIAKNMTGKLRRI